MSYCQRVKASDLPKPQVEQTDTRDLAMSGLESRPDGGKEAVRQGKPSDALHAEAVYAPGSASLSVSYGDEERLFIERGLRVVDAFWQH